jgi:O-antigen/teichoic acid export membrane protein
MISVASALGQLDTFVLLAGLGRGYMAMAWAGLVSVLVRVLGANIARPMLWAFRPRFAGRRDMFAFGAWSAATAIVSVIYYTLPQLIIGCMPGMVPVDLLGGTQTVRQLPDKPIVGALHPVILPALVEHARRGGSLKEPYLLGLSYMAAVHIPAMVCLAMLAEPVVLMVLGPQWSEVPTPVRLMAMGLVWYFPAFLTYPMLVSLGGVRDTLVSSLISLPLVAIAAPHGSRAAAATSLVAAPFQVFVAISCVRRHIGVTWAEIFRAALSGGVAMLGAAAGIVAVMWLLGFRTALAFGEMLLAILVAGFCWLGGLWLGGHPLIGELLGLWGRVRRWA